MAPSALIPPSALAVWLRSTPGMAQTVVPKLATIGPLGKGDTLNGQCSTLGLTRPTVAPTNGKCFLSGSMNVVRGYCRRQ